MSDSLDNGLTDAQETGSPDESQHAVLDSIQGLRLTLDEYGDRVQLHLRDATLLLRIVNNQGTTLDGQTRLLYALDQKMDRVLALLESSPEVPARG